MQRPADQFNWFRAKDEDLEYLPPLEPNVQDFLRGEMLPASMGIGDGLLQTSMPEPSLMEGAKWIKLHVRQLDMLAWWQELKEVPDQDDLQEFTRRVWASFQVPRQDAMHQRWIMTTLHYWLLTP